MSHVRLTILTVAALGAVAHADPFTPTWSPARSMHKARVELAATAISPNVRVKALGGTRGVGRVMVVGGVDFWFGAGGTIVYSSEIYDPAVGWVWAARAPAPRHDAFLTTLSDGRVLLVGGLEAPEGVDPLSILTVTTDSYVYDPATDSWIATGLLPAPKANAHGLMPVMALSGDRYVIAGGVTEDANGVHVTDESMVFTYDKQHPERSSWDYTRDAAGHVTRMSTPHTTGAFVKLLDGRLFYAGGYGIEVGDLFFTATNVAEIFDPATGGWTATTMPMIAGEDDATDVNPGARWAPTGVTLTDGTVLIVGGNSNHPDLNVRRSYLIFDPADGSWSSGMAPLILTYGFWLGQSLSGARALIANWSVRSTFPDDFVVDTGGMIYDEATATFSLVDLAHQPDIDSWGSKLIPVGKDSFLAVGGVGDAFGSDGPITAEAALFVGGPSGR
jgi:hypothetical protein